jgi:hypothetical protein
MVWHMRRCGQALLPRLRRPREHHAAHGPQTPAAYTGLRTGSLWERMSRTWPRRAFRRAGGATCPLGESGRRQKPQPDRVGRSSGGRSASMQLARNPPASQANRPLRRKRGCRPLGRSGSGATFDKCYSSCSARFGIRPPRRPCGSWSPARRPCGIGLGSRPADGRAATLARFDIRPERAAGGSCPSEPTDQHRHGQRRDARIRTAEQKSHHISA